MITNINSNLLYIVGCGGHARSVIDTAILIGWKYIYIYDGMGRLGERIFDYPISSKILDTNYTNVSFFVAIGDNYQRETLINDFKLRHDGLDLINIVSPMAYLSKFAIISNGIFIGNFAHIGPEVKIGKNVIINTHSIIEHECIIGNNSHIAIGAHIAGRVTIGDYCMIGAGATVRDKIFITDNVIIGAGAVVVKDINTPGIYIGNPAKKKESI